MLNFTTLIQQCHTPFSHTKLCMLDKVQKTRLRHAFSFPLSAIRHPPPAQASGSGPLFHSLWSCAGMQTLKKVPPRKPLRLLNKRVFFFALLLPNLEWLWKYRLGQHPAETAVGVRWPRSGGLQGALLGHHHWEPHIGTVGSILTVRSRKGCHGTNAKDS